MKKLMFSFFTAATLAVLFLLSCEKEKSDSEEHVSFEISAPSQLLKSTGDYNLDDVKEIYIVLQKADGSSLSFPNVKIHKMNGSFFSEKLILKAGSYILTEFLLNDSLGETIFAIPHTGSALAQYVNCHLPFRFTVSKNNKSTLNITVVSAKDRQPDDFGLVQFPITKVDLPFINFLVGVLDKETGKPIDAKLTVSWGFLANDVGYDVSHAWCHNKQSQILSAVLNNPVSIRDTTYIVDNEPHIPQSYNVVITKDGYIPFCKTYARETLVTFNDSGNNIPLIIELEKNKNPNTVVDVEGNIYKTVKIGKQVWMAENLKVKRLRDGAIIYDDYFDQYDYFSYKYPVYRLYDQAYGPIYDLRTYKISTDICPEGWHIPNDIEWTELINYLGGNIVAGGKLKEVGTGHWLSPNTGASNESGFNALPGGGLYDIYRFYDYTGSGIYGFWASSSGGFWQLDYDSASISKDYILEGIDCSYHQDPCDDSSIDCGSVRCVKD